MRTIVCAAILAALSVVGCGPGDVERAAPEGDTTSATPPQAAGLGQLVYVPVYSHIYYRNAQRQMNLTATLSIRNADLRQSITIHRVDYYDSEGRFVRPYLDAPVTIGPLSSRAYVIEEDDTRGGVGANFLVEWEAEDAVQSPIIQAVMITTASTQGISFVTEGYPILEQEGP